MEKFNLVRALAGEPIYLDGYKHYVHASRIHENSFLLENEKTRKTKRVEMGELVAFAKMWKDPSPTVTLTLPCPLKEPQEGMWYIDDNFRVSESSYYRGCDLNNASEDWLSQGRYFATEEDAQAWIDALKNSRK